MTRTTHVRQHTRSLAQQIAHAEEAGIKRETIRMRKLPQKVTSANALKWMEEFEGGNLSVAQADELFSYLVKTGQAWTLQGFYGRQAQTLIHIGILDTKGNILVKRSTKEMLYGTDAPYYTD